MEQEFRHVLVRNQVLSVAIKFTEVGEGTFFRTAVILHYFKILEFPDRGT